MWTPATQAVILLLVLVTCCDDALVAGQTTNTTSFAFASFPVPDPSIVMVEDVRHRSLYSAYDLNYYTLGDCGRIVYRDRVRLKDKATGAVASFSTSFSFSFMSSTNSTEISSDGCGAGMAFSFVASSSSLTVGEERQYICSYEYYPKPTDRVLAVKFGSRRISLAGDPSDSSIGVMVNTKGMLLPITQHNLCAASYDTEDCDYFCGDQGIYSAWIDYNSKTQMLEVFFRSGTLESGSKPSVAVITAPNLPLGDVFDEEMYAAISAKTYWSYINPEVHRVHAWNFNSSDPSPAPAAPPPSTSPSKGNPTPRPPEPNSKAGLIAGVSVGVIVAICATMGLCLYFFIIRKHRNKQPVENREAATYLDLSDQSSRPFTFKELTTMTNNFADSELLSSGAFGDVYKGTPPSGTVVAVKRIKQQKGKANESFQAEARSLRQIRHRNLLQLRGWCEAKEGLFLVYDYMINLSLDKWLHRDPTETAFDSGLSWNVRRHVLSGVAAGLTYLHEEWVQCVLHRDIKSSNVLLDADFNGHLGDFGLARLVDHEKLQKTTLLAGTLGYMAPELQYTGRATKETDVYAFGVLVLEVVCGRRPLEMQPGLDPGEYVLLDRVWRAHEAGNIKAVVDPKLSIQLSGVYQWMAMAGSFLQVGLLCCLPNPSDRPSMRMVNQWFQAMEAEVVVDLPPLPVVRPGPVAQYSMPPSSRDGTSSSDITAGSNSWASVDKVRA